MSRLIAILPTVTDLLAACGGGRRGRNASPMFVLVQMKSPVRLLFHSPVAGW
jgi:hypothetical protein